VKELAPARYHGIVVKRTRAHIDCVQVDAHLAMETIRRASILCVGPEFAMATAGRHTLLGCKLPGGGIYSGTPPFRLISREIT